MQSYGGDGNKRSEQNKRRRGTRRLAVVVPVKLPCWSSQRRLRDEEAAAPRQCPGKSDGRLCSSVRRPSCGGAREGAVCVCVWGGPHLSQGPLCEGEPANANTAERDGILANVQYLKGDSKAQHLNGEYYHPVDHIHRHALG